MSNVAVNTKVVASDSAYKSCQLQLCIEKLSLVKVYAQFSMGIVHIKRMIICNSEYKCNQCVQQCKRKSVYCNSAYTKCHAYKNGQ